MDISSNIFQNFLITNRPESIQTHQTKHSPAATINSQPVKDEFVKSTAAQTSKVDQIEKTPKQEYIKKLYNETYDEAMQLMDPIVKELNIQKPQLVFNENTVLPNSGSSETLAAYNFLNNTIDVSESLMDDNMYLYYPKDSQPDPFTMPPLTCFGEEGLRKAIMSLNTPYNGQVVKLNDKEKELVIKSCFAHELRHCVQSHLVGSCEGIKDEQKNIYDENNAQITKATDNLIAIYKECLANGIETDENGQNISQELEKLMKEHEKTADPYYKRYTPKKLLDENTILKFSVLSDDNRYISAKDHLLAGTKKQSEPEKAEDEMIYYTYPQEIDAYNFQGEYLIYTASKPEVRKDVASGLFAKYFNDAGIGLDNLEKYGYKPLIENKTA